MDRTPPVGIVDLLAELDAFVAAEIAPLQAADDNERFFDHRREWARTDFEHDGVPRPEWTALLGEMRRRADAAGFLRYALPVELGGRGGSNLAMAMVREHLAAQGLGLHNDLQDESSVIGNFPVVQLVWTFGTDEQKAGFCDRITEGSEEIQMRRVAGALFGFTGKR